MCRIGCARRWRTAQLSGIKDSARNTPFEWTVMDIQSLRYALTLAEELNFARAASVHYIAAQPFGRRIQRLERELGTRLFDRSSHHVALTPAGERFLPRAQRVISDIEALMQLAETDSSGRFLRVGVLGFGLADRWPTIRDLLARQQQDLVLSYVELNWENQYDAVRTGDVDVAVVHDVGGADDLLVERAMDTQRFAVVPAESDLANASALTAAEIGDRRWVVPAGQPGLAAWIGEDIEIGVEVRSPAATPAAVVTTGFVGMHGEPAVRYLPHPGVRYIPLQGSPAVVAVVTHTQDRRDAVATFRSAVQAAAALDGLSPTVVDNPPSGATSTD